MSGIGIVVGAAPLPRAMLETVFKLVRFNRVQFFATLDEATRYLQTQIDAEPHDAAKPATPNVSTSS